MKKLLLSDTLTMSAVIIFVAFAIQSIITDGSYNDAKFTVENHANTLIRTNLDHFLYPNRLLKDNVRILSKKIHKFGDFLHRNGIHRNRYKRETLPATNSIDKLAILERSMNEINEEILRMKDNTFLNIEDQNSIVKLQTTVKSSREHLENLKKQPGQRIDADVNEKLEIFTQSYNVVKLQLDNLRRREEEEANRRLPDDIVRHLQSNEFALAEEKLKKNNSGNIVYAVKKTYDHHAGNFDLLVRFGDSIRDAEQKFKVYEALAYEMKTSGHNDSKNLLRLSESIKREVYDRTTGPTAMAAMSLMFDVGNLGPFACKEVAFEPIFVAFFSNNSWPYWPMVKQLSNDMSRNCPQTLLNVYAKVVDRLWSKLSLIDMLAKARDNLKNLDEIMFFHENIFDKLEHDDKVFTRDMVILAHRIKSTMHNSSYESVTPVRRLQYENVKKKLPASVRNMIFDSDVRIKNIYHHEYMYSADWQYSKDKPTRPVFTWRLGGVVVGSETKFQWKLQFVDEFLVKFRNRGFDEMLFASPSLPYNHDKTHVSTWAFKENQNPNETERLPGEDWFIEIYADGIRFKNSDTDEYLIADTHETYNDYRRYVFTDHRTKGIPYNSAWQIIHCC